MCCGWCRIPKRSMFVVLAFVRRTHTYLLPFSPTPLFSIKKAASMAFSKATLDYTYILFLIHYIFYELWEDDLTEISYYLFFSFLAIPHLHSCCKRKLYCMSVILFAGNCSKKVRGSKLGLQQNKCLSEVLLPLILNQIG